MIAKILSGSSDANIGVDDLCELLRLLEFIERIQESHPVFLKNGVKEKINLQQDSVQAKPYPVRQVRNILVKYRHTGACHA
jgi:hypothetical protein